MGSRGWLSLGALLVAGCTTDDAATPSFDIGVFPRVAYSGSNPNTTFKVLFSTAAEDATWAVSDPSIASVEPAPQPKITGVDVSNLRFVTVTTKKPGETTVTVTAGSSKATAQLVVKAYTDEQIALGKTRYETASSDAARAPCASCHAQATGVDHSPLKMAGFDDSTILGVIQQATYPGDSGGGSVTGAFSPRGPLKLTSHKWNLTSAEEVGIMAHLRSLPLGGS